MNTKNPCKEVLLYRTVHLTRHQLWGEDPAPAICGHLCAGDGSEDLARLSNNVELNLSPTERYCISCLAQLEPLEYLNLVEL